MRPYTVVSCAVSIDGCLDDARNPRPPRSGAEYSDAVEDSDGVDAARAGCDAILIGANTLRRDDPRLTIGDPVLRAARLARGEAPDPIKVTMTVSGELDPDARFFTVGQAPRLVYAPAKVTAMVAARIGDAATVVPAESLREALAELRGRGVRRLLVEGGAQILAQFLADGLADELHLAVTPVLVGDGRAPRLHGRGSAAGRFQLAWARSVGDVVLLRYLLSQAATDRYWLEVAVDESRRCPVSDAAFSVGAVIVGADGREISRGYSREGGPHVHAEESALSKVDGNDGRLPDTTLYSSLEPCSVRKSHPSSCTALILAAGIRRVVYAWREPLLFVDGHGVEELRDAGVEVVEIADLADDARAVNAHLSPG